MTDTALVIIYNHRYEKNIPKLNEYYKNAFNNIFHVIPFYTSQDEQVITVYENSHQFSGYIAQASQKLMQTQLKSFVFVSDDLILNPALNESNIHAKLNMTIEDAYIKELFTFHDAKDAWLIPKNLYKFVSSKGVNYASELPTLEVAMEQAEKHHVKIKKLSSNYIRNLLKSKGSYFLKNWIYTAAYGYFKKFKNMSEIPYPLVGAYSDFFIVPRQNLAIFSKYCGVFASMDIFAEVAILTALMLACNRIIFESSNFKGKEVWTLEELKNHMEVNDKYIRNIFTNNPDFLYFHPAKLSYWNI